jgi:hypothetical protein
MRETKPYPTCGATNRQGEPCQRPPLKGKKRCRLHGGKSLETNKNAVKHGIYRKTLSDEEQALWAEIQIGSVDDEIRMMKVMLNRAIELNAEIRAAPNDVKNMAGFELSEINRTTKGGKQDTSLTSKRPDTVAMIDRFAGRIASLEKTRAELLAAAAGQQTDVNIKFVAEIPPEEPLGAWLKNYGQPNPEQSGGEG